MATIRIDPVKFKRRIKALGMPNSQVAREIGYSPSFVFDAIKRERLTEPAFLLLEAKFQIKREEIAPDEEIDLNRNPPPINEVTLDKLYTVIYDAVYHAVLLAEKMVKEGKTHDED